MIVHILNLSLRVIIVEAIFEVSIMLGGTEFAVSTNLGGNYHDSDRRSVSVELSITRFAVANVVEVIVNYYPLLRSYRNFGNGKGLLFGSGLWNNFKA